MSVVQLPALANEAVRTYVPGSAERGSLQRRITSLAAERTDMPMVVGGRELRSKRTARTCMPRAHELGRAHLGGPAEVALAIEAARAAAPVTVKRCGLWSREQRTLSRRDRRHVEVHFCRARERCQVARVAWRITPRATSPRRHAPWCGYGRGWWWR